MSVVSTQVEIPLPATRIDHVRAARQLRVPGDPTMVVRDGVLWRATLTPDGPASVEVRWSSSIRARAFGPGADWLIARVPGMVGLTDTPASVTGVADRVDRAEHDLPFLRIARSGTIYHDMLPTVIAQRITGREASRQWRALCRELGTPAPGPAGLMVPPSPDALRSRPTWWYHRLGIEGRRAETLREVARHGDRLLDLGGPEHAAGVTDGATVHDFLQLISGVGRWTAGTVAGTALGHPDEIPVGDFHLKNQVVYALTGRPRGSDDEMLELLEPFRGQRNRVVHLLLAHGARAPARGPRRRILPMARW